MADNLIYEESLNTESETSEFISKKWVYVNDNNAQNYTSQVVIDSTPLSNAGGYISWQEGFIVMPLVVQLTSTSPASLPANTNIANYAWAFKSGFWQMINSMTVEFNNQNIIQQTPFLNVFRSFKANTSFSQDDLFNEGSSLGFYPDSPAGWTYQTNFAGGATSFSSTGQNVPFTNNTDANVPVIVSGATTAADAVVPAGLLSYPSSPVAGTPVINGAATTFTYTGSQIQSGGVFNEGMFIRQGWYNFNNVAAANTTGQAALNNLNSAQAVYRSTIVSSTAGSVVWNTYAKLRLKDLADFFEKTPLLKGSTIRFYINTNQSIVTFGLTSSEITAASGATTPPVLTPTVVSVTGGLTCPIMLASAALGQGLSPVAQAANAGEDTYQLSVSIVQNNNSSQGANLGSTVLKSCRLYAPVYYMSPLAESKYLSLTPTKKIMYKDIFQYQFNNVPNGNFNFLVTNGISNICSVLVVPFISQTNAFTTSTGAASTKFPFSSPQNPCSGSPSSPDPIIITNFNILISGVNLFLNNILYDFEAFRCNLLQSNQINGSLTTGLASGLVSESSFTNLYRYYYGDASRILPSEKGVSRSVQIVGNNSSQASCDLMVFVEFMREITIDISTGARIE